MSPSSYQDELSHRLRLIEGIAVLSRDPLPTLYAYKGCRGLRYCQRRCPVALWLSRSAGAPVEVSAVYACIVGDVYHLYDLPDNLTQLIYEIDSGGHPNLLSKIGMSRRPDMNTDRVSSDTLDPSHPTGGM